MKPYLFALIAGLTIFASACTTTRDVMPGADGINHVSLKSEDDENGRELAISEAKQYCKDKDKEAVFLDSKTKYQGSMDEETKKTIKKASTAAILVGGMADAGSWRNGDYHNDTGNVLMGAGGVGHVMTSDKDYAVDVKFKCQ